MKVLVVCKERLENLPPIMTLARALAGLGLDVEVLTSISSHQTKAVCNTNGFSVTDVFPHAPSNHHILQKVAFWRIFHQRAWNHIEQKGSGSLLWIATGDTALALGRQLLSRDYVLELLELYDQRIFYKHSLAKYIRAAVCTVVPEVCRAAILRVWYKLDRTPFVLPNKPLGHPRKRNMNVSDKSAKQILSELRSGSKIILYQGHIGGDRDLRPLCQAVQQLPKDWRLVLMGTAHGSSLEDLRKYCTSLIHVGHIPPPYHLEVTSRAYIGVLTYRLDSLNNAFCAPNKVWEYGGFGLPMLCNDVPGLKHAVDSCHAGISVDFDKVDRVTAALYLMEENYGAYSHASEELFMSVNVEAIVEEILEFAAGHSKRR